MKQIELCIGIATIALVSLLNLAQAAEVYPKDEFSISLPDGWVGIPKDVINENEQKIARATPNIPAQHADYGFQLGSAKNWFAYPYILIQVRNTGRIPESQLKQAEGYSIKESINKHKNDWGPVMSDIQAGKMYYDKDAKLIWLRMEMEVVGVGQISGLSAMVPTEKGFIQVNAYSLKNDFSMYEQMFISSAMSVTPNIELAYKPRWSDNLPPAVSGIDWGQVVSKAIAGAIIGLIVALFIGARRKKR